MLAARISQTSLFPDLNSAVPRGGLGLRWAGITAFECILARIQIDPEMLENAFPMQKSLKIQMH